MKGSRNMTTNNETEKRSPIGKVLHAILTVLCVLFALFAINRIALCNERQYNATYGYCDECYRELEIINLIPASNGNALVCAQCIDEYTKCVICDIYYDNDAIVDRLYCENCVDSNSIVGATTQGTPIVSIDLDSIPWESPHESDCFSEIAYDEDSNTLYVRFRESGSAYRYLDFSESAWDEFASQESLGSWYNKAIKGKYECQKIEE